jgi:hypothetical protein
MAVGMMLFGQAAVACLHRLEISVGLKLQNIERAHLVATAAAVARSCPAIVSALAIGKASLASSAARLAASSAVKPAK